MVEEEEDIEVEEPLVEAHIVERHLLHIGVVEEATIHHTRCLSRDVRYERIRACFFHQNGKPSRGVDMGTSTR